MIIDCEHHMFMPEQIKNTGAPGKLLERNWDGTGNIKSKLLPDAANIERHIEFMDQAGIDMSVLTTNFINGLEQMKRWNDFSAAIVKKYPKRFIGFACIPALGGEPAMDELDRAVNGLGLKGVHIWTRIDGEPLDSRKLWGFYEKVSRLNVPIDVHVTIAPPGFDGLSAPYGLYYTIARELDMCVTVLRVCLGGVLEDFPDLKLIMNHFGGGVSSLAERFDAYLGYTATGTMAGFYSGKALTTRPWREYYNKLYFNMAGREVGMGAVKCALTDIAADKLVFGTDWPFNYTYDPEGVRSYAEDIRKLDVPPEAAEAMLGGNAVKLFGV